MQDHTMCIWKFQPGLKKNPAAIQSASESSSWLERRILGSHIQPQFSSPLHNHHPAFSALWTATIDLLPVLLHGLRVMHLDFLVISSRLLDLDKRQHRVCGPPMRHQVSGTIRQIHDIPRGLFLILEIERFLVWIVSLS